MRVTTGNTQFDVQSGNNKNILKSSHVAHSVELTDELFQIFVASGDEDRLTLLKETFPALFPDEESKKKLHQQRSRQQKHKDLSND